MTREEFVLAALASVDGASYTPVQVQKMFFLIDKNIADLVGGPHFRFTPYNYGAFDKAVYESLESLARDGCVSMRLDTNWNVYTVTPSGQTRGRGTFESLDETARNFIRAVSEFVRNLTFTQLVAAMYRAYPETRVNSVFQE